MHKAECLGREQTSRSWLQQRIRAAIPHATSVEELFAYLEADGVEVKVRRLPSEDLQGYSVGRPGDVNAKGEQVYTSGGKIAPDLSLPKVHARLAASTPEESPNARRNKPCTTWHHATSALDTLHDHLTDLGSRGSGRGARQAEAQIIAFGEIIDATAQTAPAELRAQLRAASATFTRAQRSRIKADHQAATDLRRAARDIAAAVGGPQGAALDVLLTTLVWSVTMAARWHQAQGHRQQAQAAHRTVSFFDVATDRVMAASRNGRGPRAVDRDV